MATISEALAIGVQNHQAGQLQAAEQIYRQILAVDPNQADALHLLGVVASQMGQHALAAQYIGRAIELNGSDCAFHSNLGNALKAQGRLDEAIASYRQALALNPDDSGALYNLGIATRDQGRLEEAVACFSRALALNPGLADAHNNLGTTFQAQGKLDEAADAYRRTLELRPNHAEASNNLGAALQAQGKFEEAVACFRRAVVLKPDYAEAHNNLGNALHALGRPGEAVNCCRRALELKPNYAEAHSNLGNALKDQGKIDEAVACYGRSLELKPDEAVTHYHLGNALRDQGKPDEAVVHYVRALELKPDHPEAHCNLGAALSDQGRHDEAVASFRRALELKPDFAEALSNLLFARQYLPGSTLPELFAAHAEYERLHAAPLRTFWRPHENDRDAGRCLRVGFVSPDFGQHPVGFFLIRALESLDRSQCETVCYCDRLAKDDLTSRFEAAATYWREVSRWSDEELAQKIREDRIDILFDLAGHSARNRLLVFARKPAPIQVTWAGYVGTTGLEAMDYILADRHQIPPGAEAHYWERVLRMPDGYLCYDPPPYAPEVTPLPALVHGSVTLGSFNNPAKLTTQMVEVWAKVLDRVPQSRLVMRLKNPFAGGRIDPRRVECLGWLPHRELLAEYGRIDLALDTFPYSGGLTTCEAMWMGVPVITSPGDTFASRHSLSHLSTVGLTETIVRDLDEYGDLAVALASDLPRLAALRAGLRERMAASPLCDGKRFAENLTRVLRDVWRQWCLEK